MRLFFEDVVTEQDDPAYSWEEADHGQHQSTFFIFILTLLTLNVFRRG